MQPYFEIRVLVDWNVDGSFGGPHADVTRFLDGSTLEISLGTNTITPKERLRPVPSSVDITLVNVDGTFSITNPNSPLAGRFIRNIPIRVETKHSTGVTWAPLFHGLISKYTNRTVVNDLSILAIECLGYAYLVAGQDSPRAPLVGLFGTTDFIIRETATAAGIPSERLDIPRSEATPFITATQNGSEQLNSTLIQTLSALWDTQEGIVTQRPLTLVDTLEVTATYSDAPTGEQLGFADIEVLDPNELVYNQLAGDVVVVGLEVFQGMRLGGGAASRLETTSPLDGPPIPIRIAPGETKTIHFPSNPNYVGIWVPPPGTPIGPGTRWPFGIYTGLFVTSPFEGGYADNAPDGPVRFQPLTNGVITPGGIFIEASVPSGGRASWVHGVVADGPAYFIAAEQRYHWRDAASQRVHGVREFPFIPALLDAYLDAPDRDVHELTSRRVLDDWITKFNRYLNGPRVRFRLQIEVDPHDTNASREALDRRIFERIRLEATNSSKIAYSGDCLVDAIDYQLTSAGILTQVLWLSEITI